MPNRTEYLTMQTQRAREFVNITDRVRRVVRASGVDDGLVLVSSKRFPQDRSFVGSLVVALDEFLRIAVSRDDTVTFLRPSSR